MYLMNENIELNELSQSIETNKNYVSLGELILKEELPEDVRKNVNFHVDYLKGLVKTEEKFYESKKEALENRDELRAICTKEEWEEFEAEQKLPLEVRVKHYSQELIGYKLRRKLAGLFCFFPLKRIRKRSKKLKESYDDLINTYEHTLKAFEDLKKSGQEVLGKTSEYDQDEAKFYEKIKQANPHLNEETLVNFARTPKLYSYAVLDTLKREYLSNPLAGEYDFLNPEEQQ